MMKLLLLFLTTAVTISTSTAFTPSKSHEIVRVAALEVGYIPDGMSPEQWRQLKKKENASNAKKKFGAYGPQSFKSRSLQSFQQDLEKGKAGHLLPVFNAKDKVKRGEIKNEDIPYMQRGGSWDNSDISAAKKMKWSSADKRYNANAAPARYDWNNGANRTGPAQKKQNAATAAKKGTTPQTKKLFGLF